MLGEIFEPKRPRATAPALRVWRTGQHDAVQSRALHEALQRTSAGSHIASPADIIALQRVIGNRATIQRQKTAATTGQAIGDAVRPQVEGLLKTFAAASAYEAKNAAATQAVNAIIRAYNMSTTGLARMRYDPELDSKASAETRSVEGDGGQSENQPKLPPLPPDQLAEAAKWASVMWNDMPSAQQANYRPEFESVRDRLFERLNKEAPRPLRPPPKGTSEWRRWLNDRPPDDPFTMEYQDWLSASNSPLVAGEKGMESDQCISRRLKGLIVRP